MKKHFRKFKNQQQLENETPDGYELPLIAYIVSDSEIKFINK